MGEEFEFRIDSILGGISPNLFMGEKNQFHSSIAIDPDLPMDDSSAIKTSGALRPIGYSKFSGTGINSYPNWLVTVPQTGGSTYTYLFNGRFVEYDSTLASGPENPIGTPAGGAGNGAAYYNNYVYCSTTSSVARFGPLDAAGPVFNNDWWGNESGKTSLQNLTYPTGRGVVYPNHPMHLHNDGRLYFGDYDNGTTTAGTRGRGMIHYIRTQSSGSVEGTADNSSVFNALTLPPGQAPIDIESWGTDLVIATIPAGADATIISGKAKLFFWDTVASTWYKAIDLPDPLVSALLFQNGMLYVWTGNLNNGYRVSRYLGGFNVEQVAFFEEGVSPPAGSVDGLGNRVAWGGFATYPESVICVYALGYKDAKLPMALHNIIKTTGVASASVGMVSALKFVQQASNILPRLIVGWLDSNTSYGIDKLGTTYGVSVYRSNVFSPGKPFKLKSISIPLGAAVGAGMTLVLSVMVDDVSTTYALTTINNTNFPGSQRRIVFKDLSIEGKNNFFIELRWSGTALLPVTLPIVIKGITYQDATR